MFEDEVTPGQFADLGSDGLIASEFTRVASAFYRGLYGGTSEIMKTIIARDITGLRT